MDVLRVFHDFQGFFMIFKGVFRVFQGCFKRTFKVFQKRVSCCMALIAASRAEGGLVFAPFWLIFVKTPTQHNIT